LLRLRRRGSIREMKSTVYIETTIPSYLTAWPSRDLVRAAHQQITREWWARRGGFDLYASRLVVQECQAGDAAAAAGRLAALAGIPLLEQTAEAGQLAVALLHGVPLPDKAAADALHIAIAAFHGIQYLLTWNYTHIANVALRPHIEAVCRAAGYEPPLISTPEELPSEDSGDA
jgi:predicted nucleic acid-binding protein